MHLHPPRRSVSTAVVLFQVCPILDSNRDQEVYRDVSYSEVIMRTILPFILAAWIVMPTVSCAQVGKDSTSPGQLAPGVSQKAVLEASLGNPPPVGWKWQVQERTRPRGGDVVHHTNSALYYTLEETHELVRGNTVETFARGQAVFVPAGLEHIHRMLPLGSALRTFEIYFAPGDGSRPSPGAGVRPLYFSEKAMDVMPGVTYTIRVVEVTLLPGARQDLTPRERQINYVLEGVMTRRVGDQVLRYEPSSVLELPIGGTPFTASNESAMPMRFLVVDLVLVPASASAPPR